jgi:hypothetical protein
MSAIFNRPFGLQDTNYHVDPNTYSDEAFRGQYTGTNLIYKGFARPGSLTSDPVWQIAFLTYDGSNNVLSIQWPLLSLPGPETSGENVGTVTTPWTSFAGTIDNLPILPGSLSVQVGSLVFIDQGDGTLEGGGSNTGTIDYATGALALTINPALATDTPVIASYSQEVIGGASNDYLFAWDRRADYTYV